MKLYFQNRLISILLKHMVIFLLFSLITLFVKAQGIYEGNAADLKPVFLPNQINEMYVTDVKGEYHQLGSYLKKNKKFSNKPFLFLVWGTGDSQRGFKTLKELALNNLGKEYNVVALYIDWKELSSKAMNNAIEKEKATQFADQFFMLATNFSILEKGFFAKQFPLAIFADASLKNIFTHQVMPYKNTVLMLKKIEAGLDNKEKIWLTKEAAVVEETDAEAAFFQRFSVNGNQISISMGNKEMILSKESFIFSNDKFLRHGDFLIQSEKRLVSAMGHFKEGIVIDTFKLFYPSGKIKLIHPPNGIFKMYDLDGKVNLTGEIKNGLGTGFFTLFDEGKVVANYNYEMGKQVGIQKQLTNGVVVSEFFLSADYEYAGVLKEGLQKVKKNDLYGYTDRTGKIIIPIKYELADDFEKGFAKVLLGKKNYKIDKVGNLTEILDPNATVKEKTKLDKYDRVDAFSTKGFRKVELNKKFGFIDAEDNEIVPPIYDEVWDFYEGVVAVKVNGKFGYVNDKGTVIIPPKYVAGDMFIKGKARVAIRNNDEYKYGYVDKSGKELIPIVYNYPIRLGDDFFKVKENGKYKIVDWQNRIIQPAIFEDIEQLIDSMIRVKTNGKYGFLNDKAMLVLPAVYYLANDFKNGIAEVTLKEFGDTKKINRQGVIQ